MAGVIGTEMYAVDALVIGGGMAGSMAAIVAAQEGLSVALVRKGYGATALSSGAIDFPAAWPLAEPVQEAAQLFQAEMEAVGYPYVGEIGRQEHFLTVLGARKEATFYPATVAAGALGNGVDGHLLFVGIRGLQGFAAPYLAQAAQVHVQASWVGVDFPSVCHTHNILAFELAQLLDEDRIAAEFAQVLCKAVSGRARHTLDVRVALPPVVGVDHSQEIMARLREACGLPCFELFSAPPSLLGFRLQRALDRALERHGVRLIHGTVEWNIVKAGRITEVVARDKDIQYIFRPQAVVLSSGKFIGGGLVHEGCLREAIFDLPLWVQGRRVDDATPQALSSPYYGDAQPFMAVGVRVDECLRPVGIEGRAIYANLWAAGAILQDQDYTAGCGGLGEALVQGYRVGRLVSAG